MQNIIHFVLRNRVDVFGGKNGCCVFSETNLKKSYFLCITSYEYTTRRTGDLSDQQNSMRKCPLDL